MNRRDLIKLGAVGGAAVAAGVTNTELFADKGGSGGGVIAGGNRVPDSMRAPSPITRPWLVEMPRLTPATPTKLTNYNGAAITPQNCLSPEDGVQRSVKQHYNDYYPVNWYEWREREDNHEWHPDLPTQKIWGFDGMFPGPHLISRYGKPDMVRIHNDLPGGKSNLGFGIPSTTTHLH